VSAPTVDLSLSIDRSQQSQRGSYDVLEPILNNPEKASEYATSVLLSNTFLLTTDSAPSSSAFTSSAFNSVSQLVVNQLNRFLGSALPNVDFSLGVQGESAQELDVTYGVALRLLDERLVIRGEGVYQGTRSAVTANAAGQYMQGAFTVEIRLNDAVSVAVFYRREGDVITAESVPTNTTGAGLTYKTEFPTWRRFFRQIFGWLIGGGDESGATAEPVAVGSGA